MDRTDQTEAAFRRALDALLTEPDGPIGVAVSGGGDSMALLAMAARAGLNLVAATVDHGLRPAAADEARMVARFCRDAGLRHDILPITDLAAGPNLAARARAARYDALVAWVDLRGVRTILLGHTRDDQAETVLLRLARGSGADGLAAMRPARDWRGIRWLRPTLDLDRTALRDWLRANRIAWIDDPTNDDPSFDRVRVRRAMGDLAALGLTRDRLAATARLLARQCEVLEAAGADLARSAMRPGALGEIYLDPAALGAALTDTALRVLADALIAVSGAPYRPRLQALEDMLARATGPDFRGATLSGCTLAPHGDRIMVCREPAAMRPTPLEPGLWDGRWNVDTQAGQDLWIAPLGEDGLQRATRELRRTRQPAPPGWSGAPRTAQRAVPAIFRSATATPEALVAVPSAGLVLDPAAAHISIQPPSPGQMRHQGAK